MSLYEKKNYIIDIPYIFNQYIREYDIAQANINILLAKGVIDSNLYDKLSNSDRMIRQVYIGNMIKADPSIQEVLNEGLIEYKKLFFEANGLTDNDIIAIKNDAIFILNKIPRHTQFGNVRFVNKNTYTSFMKLYSLEIYYGCINMEIIDVKGIKDNDLELYHTEFLGIIIDFLRYINKEGPASAFHYITYIINEYVNRRLSIGTYRRFSSYNDYLIIGGIDRYSIQYLADTVSNKKCIDISHNLGILRLMHRYASELLYEQNMRK